MNPGLILSNRRIQWTLRAATCLLAGCAILAGCQTKKAPPPKPPEPPRGYLNTMPGNAILPALPVSKLDQAIGEVLAAHGFPPPKTILNSDGTTWELSPRPRSATEVSMVVVKVSPKGEVQVELEGYAYVGSAWAVLGTLFTEPLKHEAAEMEKQIQEKLKNPPS